VTGIRMLIPLQIWHFLGNGFSMHSVYLGQFSKIHSSSSQRLSFASLLLFLVGTQKFRIIKGDQLPLCVT